MMVGGVCIGALNLFHTTSGALTLAQHGDALAVARVAARVLMSWQSEAGGESLPWQLEQVPAHRAAVHQASGMVSIQGAISVDDALVLLRAHAFAEDRTISAVADAVVGRQLRFDDGVPEVQA